jgi:hypothetical protein
MNHHVSISVQLERMPLNDICMMEMVKYLVQNGSKA